VWALGPQLGQALLDVSGVLTDRVKRAADVVASLSMALALNQQGQLHQRSLQGESVVMQAFKNIGERVFGGGYSFDSIRGSGELSSGNV